MPWRMSEHTTEVLLLRAAVTWQLMSIIQMYFIHTGLGQYFLSLPFFSPQLCFMLPFHSTTFKEVVSSFIPSTQQVIEQLLLFKRI